MRSGCIWGISSYLWGLTVGRYKKRGRLETHSASRHHLTVENALILPIQRPNHHRTRISIKFNVSPITYILHIQNEAILDRKQVTNMKKQNPNLLCVRVTSVTQLLNYSQGQITCRTLRFLSAFCLWLRQSFFLWQGLSGYSYGKYKIKVILCNQFKTAWQKVWCVIWARE